MFPFHRWPGSRPRVSPSRREGGKWTQEGPSGTTAHRRRPQGQACDSSETTEAELWASLPFSWASGSAGSWAPLYVTEENTGTQWGSEACQGKHSDDQVPIPSCLRLYRLTHSRSYKLVHIKKHHCSHILYLRHTTGNERVSQKWPLHHKSGCISAVQHKTHFWWDSKND